MKSKKPNKIATGNAAFTQWLDGGYERDIITTIYGPPGTGKTNFCLMASAIQAELNNKVIYIDTEGGFSVERLKQIITADKWFKKSPTQLMQNILLLKPTSFAEQKQAFNRLNQEIKKAKKVSLIIVDSIAMLYRLELGIVRQDLKQQAEEEIIKQKEKEKIRDINLALARQLKQLNEIARKHNIAVLVTNQVYSQADEIHMVGGDILKYWSKCLIELKKGDNIYIAILQKHRYLPQREFAYKICNAGIAKVRFRLF